MEILKYEKEIARDCGTFLEEKGYKVKEDTYGLEYEKEGICIFVFFDLRDRCSLLEISFPNNRRRFDIGRIASVRSGLKQDSGEMVNNVIVLMDYLKRNYDKITDYNYCKESRRLIHEEFIMNKEKYKKAVVKFLEKNGGVNIDVDASIEDIINNWKDE